MKTASVREMLEQHRANPACASCHARMDPLGFSLENFDAIGQWRTKDGDVADQRLRRAAGRHQRRWAGGAAAALLQQKEQFVKAVTGKLLMYALGREIDYHDAPAIRAIRARRAAGGRLPLVVDDSRRSSKSTPFQMQEDRP